MLLKNYFVANSCNQIKDTLFGYASSDKIINNTNKNSIQKGYDIKNKIISKSNNEIDENNEYMSNLPSDVIIGIARYLNVNDFYNFSRTCKKLYSTFFCSSIWYNYLKIDYPEAFKAISISNNLYDTYRYFDTNTLIAKNMAIAEMGKNWRLNEEGCAILTDTCWFDINGEFKYVTNGTYIVKCVIKIENVSGGLVGLEISAKYEGSEEPYKFSMSRICYENLKGIGYQPLTCFKIKVNNPSLYTKVKIQIFNKKCYWKYGFSIKSIILKKTE
ncbi:hypothetical protein BCR36DRAFT_402757 [Piromyces finnis]|uniref:F-box domain-containing protein n=1 Tax=Piromyces finnis TaxID=1754191 RepID=A0A1Y1VH39_9FUNG|nr:hypothetical protein BCR36DRAFT_402757 [Piromyces finnis]|eukprot:ORX55970.1 hypothetical protein BCR36DRAFT_402757 [Piromyces finnis]